jgi:hypothetical protein
MDVLSRECDARRTPGARTRGRRSTRTGEAALTSYRSTARLEHSGDRPTPLRSERGDSQGSHKLSTRELAGGVGRPAPSAHRDAREHPPVPGPLLLPRTPLAESVDTILRSSAVLYLVSRWGLKESEVACRGTYPRGLRDALFRLIADFESDYIARRLRGLEPPEPVDVAAAQQGLADAREGVAEIEPDRVAADEGVDKHLHGQSSPRDVSTGSRAPPQGSERPHSG